MLQKFLCAPVPEVDFKASLRDVVEFLEEPTNVWTTKDEQRFTKLLCRVWVACHPFLRKDTSQERVNSLEELLYRAHVAVPHRHWYGQNLAFLKNAQEPSDQVLETLVMIARPLRLSPSEIFHKAAYFS